MSSFHAPGVRSLGLKRVHSTTTQTSLTISGGRSPSRGHGGALTRLRHLIIRGFILWQIGNLASTPAQVSVLDAYTGKTETSRLLQPGAVLNDKLQLAPLNGWYDLIVTVAGDLTFKYHLAGHVETGDDSFSDPALGGLVTPPGLT